MLDRIKSSKNHIIKQIAKGKGRIVTVGMIKENKVQNQ